MSLFRKKEDTEKDFYEQCFVDFQRRTHESIKHLVKENEELKSVINDIKHILNNQMDYREFVDIVNDIEEILERVNKWIKKN